jgi:hypothetical protein
MNAKGICAKSLSNSNPGVIFRGNDIIAEETFKLKIAGDGGDCEQRGEFVVISTLN